MPDPGAFLPLTTQVFHVLAALSDEERHGYAIIRAVDEATDGEIVLRTGTLYTILRRLLEQRLIVETAERPAPAEDDDRRRYYAITPLGRDVARAEAARLARLVSFARRRRLLPRGAGGDR